MLGLELREPSLFQKGELIAAESVVIKYSQQTLDSIGSDVVVAKEAKDYQNQYEALNEVITEAVVALLPEGKVIAGSAVRLLLKEFKRSA